MAHTKRHRTPWWRRAWRYIGILRMCRKYEIKLAKWQRGYIWRGPDTRNPMPMGRITGKTTAVCLRALMVNAQGTILDNTLMQDPDFMQHGVTGVDFTLHQYDLWRRRFSDLGYKTRPFMARSHMQAAAWRMRQNRNGYPDGIDSRLVIVDELSQLRNRKRGQEHE